MSKTTLTKPDLVKVIAEKGDMTKKDALAALNTVIDSIKQVVFEEKKDLVLAGFGKATVEHKPATKKFFGITKDVIEVPAHDVVKFKFSKTLSK